ncbi:MAG TPA: hypothetical protein VN282_21625 [Pyrinomonadaceae bacterium]|nr:hypothetical protein [Pyrinomonadaceae bacterium]
MKKFYLSAIALITIVISLYYLGPLKPIVDAHWEISLLILGIIIGLIPSALMGHIGNRITEEKNKKSREAKLKQFIDRLSSEARKFVYSRTDDSEVEGRREAVASIVKRLSQEIFGQDYPPIETIRPGETVYPELPCKWCHRGHQSDVGARGDCINCQLPMDLWVGIQGDTQRQQKQ